VLISSSKEALLADVGDLWDSGITNLQLTNNIIYSGIPLQAFQKCYWKVMTWDEHNAASDWSDISLFTMGPLKNIDWPAEWIGRPESLDKTHFPVYSKEFELKHKPLDAYLYVNALGYSEILVNGKKVSDDILSPSVSDYSKHTLYVTYDIKPFLKEGRNTISIWMGHGWNRLQPKRSRYYGVVEGVPLARVFARLNYPQDSCRIIRTDRSWQYRRSNRQYVGSWVWGDFGGERVDLHEEMNAQGVVDSQNRFVDNYVVHNIPVIAQRNNPTQIIDTIIPVEIKEIENNECLIDFGKHINGWLTFEFNGQKSDSTIRIEYIDKILDMDSITDQLTKRFTKELSGDKDTKGYISYNQHDIIVPANKEREKFQNKFNYHAFRWVKVSGINKEDIILIKALQFSEKNEQIATFECSNPLFNKIWDAVINTYRCINYSGYVVDCPHRERKGYGGDSHSSLETALSIFDLRALCNKWTLDWNAAIYPTGLWPHSAPEFPSHKNKFSPGWGGFGMFLPWQYYNYYGDTVNLARAYPHIKKWIKFLESNTVDGILKKDSLYSNSFGAFHGDWVAPYYSMHRGNRVDQNSTNFFNNCFYLYELDMAIKIATVLGESEDVKHYAKLYDYSKPRIHKQFYDEKNKWYSNGEQPYQAFPLLINLMPDSIQPGLDELLEYLIVEKNNGHLNTGMLGTYFMLEYLMKAGKDDLIYTMVNQKTFPGWGYMIENGATTIWEQWNGDNSQIHNCYLAIGKWFVQGLGGIQINMEKAGLPTIVITPKFIEDLEYVDVSYDTRYGPVVSNWENKSNTIVHNLEIPVNVKTLYEIPKMEKSRILLDGVIINDAEQNMMMLDPGTHEIRIIK